MGTELPKPFLKISGKPILEHTLHRFAGLESLRQVIVAASRDDFERIDRILNRLPDRIESAVVEGGSERQDSIYNALLKSDDSVGLIAIHDAVRPLVTEQEIRSCLEAAAREGAAILAAPMRDTIKLVDNEGRIRETPDREVLMRAQTPQIFRRDLILRAYENARTKNLMGTDDAALAEAIGVRVQIVEGSEQNIKITWPVDLKLAELLLAAKDQNKEGSR